MIKLDSLYYFLTLAELKHFGRASERLFITQQALSKHIKQLEEKLGVLLFCRRGQELQLTDAGLKLQQRAENVLGKLQHLESQFLATGVETLPSSLRIKYTTLSQVPAMMVIKQLLRTYPNLQVQLSPARPFADVERQLLAQEIDCAFTLRPPQSPRLMSLLSEVTPFIVAVAVDSDYQHWDDCPYILYGHEPPFQEYESLFLPPELAFQPVAACTDIETAIDLCAHGAGAIYVPKSFIWSSKKTPRFKLLPHPPFQSYFTTYMIWNPDLPETVMGRVFVSEFISGFNNIQHPCAEI